jgi:xanthine phosphoribosyltransferase
VDNFLNHQIDVLLFLEMGQEFKKGFSDKKIDKILTIESWESVLLLQLH